MRQSFFGKDASTEWNRDRLQHQYGDRYVHHAADIRDREAMAKVFSTYGTSIELIIHS